MASLVSVEEFACRRPEPLTADEKRRAECLLQDASDLVREVVGCDCLTDPIPATVRLMVIRLASRALDNPNGIQSESIGDASYRLARHAQGGMQLSADERRELERACGIPPVTMAPVGVGVDRSTYRLFAPVGTSERDRVEWRNGRAV
ncbi:hypothetical protein ACIQU6_07575 [Streptomyces sp. NPDC090442]|uniref:hypothetical protein n=1 Tax=Streptomyces sp. NPDC090442 TaxID=3365962 RepID=UPI003800D1D3